MIKLEEDEVWKEQDQIAREEQREEVQKQREEQEADWMISAIEIEKNNEKKYESNEKSRS